MVATALHSRLAPAAFLAVVVAFLVSSCPMLVGKVAANPIEPAPDQLPRLAVWFTEEDAGGDEDEGEIGDEAVAPVVGLEMLRDMQQFGLECPPGTPPVWPQGVAPVEGWNDLPHPGAGVELLPVGLLYQPYLAGLKESRMGTHLVYERNDGWLSDSTLGSQIGLLRWGHFDPVHPVAVQLGMEGSAQLRLDLGDEVDLRSVDFRAGVPLTIALGRHRTKLAYYHLSSHAGDEFLLKHPAFQRLNFSRDALVLGHAYYLSERLRLYGEAGWAFHSEFSRQWEFQFGVDYSPQSPTGSRGAPFFGVNGHLREEVGFGGGIAVEAGWAWRAARSQRMLRIGGLYYNGKSPQFSFYNDHEEQFAIGVWIDP